MLIDYAHNPDGLARLLAVGRTLVKDNGRLSLLLGQAGNRDNNAITELAQTAAVAKPEQILIKELPSMLRGRQAGEVSALLHAGLLTAGFPAGHIAFETDEMVAVRRLLSDAQTGDVLILPVHQKAAREAAAILLDEMERIAWHVGQPLP